MTSFAHQEIHMAEISAVGNGCRGSNLPTTCVLLLLLLAPLVLLLLLLPLVWIVLLPYY